MATQGSLLRILKKADGTAINAIGSQAATFQSEELLIGEFGEFGLMNKWVEDSGSGTYDVTVEVSPDSGATWWSMPDTFNSQTAASMAQITATGQDIKYWRNPLPNHANVRVRFVFTGASTPDYTLTSYVFGQDIKRATDL